MKEDKEWARAGDIAWHIAALMFLILTLFTSLILLAVMDDHHRIQRRYRKWVGEKKWEQLTKD